MISPINVLLLLFNCVLYEKLASILHYFRQEYRFYYRADNNLNPIESNTLRSNQTIVRSIGNECTDDLASIV